MIIEADPAVMAAAKWQSDVMRVIARLFPKVYKVRSRVNQAE